MPPPLWLSVLRLCRIGTWFSPAADVVASAAVLQVPWSIDVARAAGASVLLYGAGMVWNDIADRRVDATQRPERPLPSGAVSIGLAVGIGLTLLIGGIALSPCRNHHLWIAGLVLAYDFGSKRLPAAGALLMGGLRALNLGTALAIVPTADAATAPLWLACVCYLVYIVAVTVLGIYEDSRHPAPRAVAAVQTAPPIAALAGVFAVQGGLWPAPTLLAVPALWFLRRNTRRREWPQAEIRRSMLILLLGTMLFTASLCLAADQPLPALAILAAIPLARAIARRIALT